MVWVSLAEGLRAEWRQDPDFGVDQYLREAICLGPFGPNWGTEGASPSSLSGMGSCSGSSR